MMKSFGVLAVMIAGVWGIYCYFSRSPSPDMAGVEPIGSVASTEEVSLHPVDGATSGGSDLRMGEQGAAPALWNLPTVDPSEALEGYDYGQYEKEIERHLKPTPARNALKVMLVANRGVALEALVVDEAIMASAEQELEKDSIGSIAAVKDAFASLSSGDYRIEREYLLQVAAKLGRKDPIAAEAAKSFLVSELALMNSDENESTSEVDSYLGVTALAQLATLNPEAELRASVELAFFNHHPDPEFQEAYQRIAGYSRERGTYVLTSSYEDSSQEQSVLEN